MGEVAHRVIQNDFGFEMGANEIFLNAGNTFSVLLYEGGRIGSATEGFDADSACSRVEIKDFGSGDSIAKT